MAGEGERLARLETGQDYIREDLSRLAGEVASLRRVVWIAAGASVAGGGAVGAVTSGAARAAAVALGLPAW